MHFVVCAVLVGLLWWRWADLRLRRFNRPGVWRALLAAFVVFEAAYALCFAIHTSWARGARNVVPLPLHISAYLWHLIVLPLVCIVIGTQWLIAFLSRAAHRRSEAKRSTPTDPAPLAPTLSRRRLIGVAAAVAIPPIVLSGISSAAFIQSGRFRTQYREIVVPGLPPDLHGLTIAQVSDLHMGKLTRPGMPQRIAEAANAMNADLMIFSGDLIDYSLEDLPAGIEFIRRLAPRHGPDFLVMIEGNHDLLDDGDAFESRIRSAGLPILIDEARIVRVPGRKTPIQLLGLCWGRPGAVERLHMEDDTIGDSMDRVMPLRDRGAFPILLTHHPHAFDRAAEEGLPLTLAGHTHGGQIMLTDHIGGGPVRFRYWTGLYRKKNSQLFVNNGVGNWFPLRFHAPEEIVKITLRADQ